MMDSTFMGTWRGGPAFEGTRRTDIFMWSIAAPAAASFCPVSVSTRFSAFIANGSSRSAMSSLLKRDRARTSPNEQKSNRRKQMLDAHEALCEAAPENFSRFKDVLDYLKQDLHHETAREVIWPSAHVAISSSRAARCVVLSDGFSHWLAAARPHPPARALQGRDSGRRNARLRFPPRSRRGLYRNNPAGRSAPVDRRGRERGFSMRTAARFT